MTQECMDTDPTLLAQASPQAQEVLQRIGLQRERICARQRAEQEALATQGAVQAAPGSVLTRLADFGRQHPLVCTAGLGLALLLGPRRLLRLTAMALPIVMKLRR